MRFLYASVNRVRFACPAFGQFVTQALHPQAITLRMCLYDIFKNVGSAICGTIIDNDDFIVRIALFQERLDTASDIAFLVARRHNNGDQRIVCRLLRVFRLGS